MKTAIITLSPQGAQLAQALAAEMDECEVYLHSSVKPQAPAGRRRDAWAGRPCHAESRARRPRHIKFARIADLTRKLFGRCRNLIYIAPTGLVVRAIAPCIKHKLSDPAVVVVDAGGRWAVSLLSGHEGGANELTMTVANVLDAEPVITTTTEAVKTVIVGVGCRRGVSADSIIAAIDKALAKAGVTMSQVRMLASADIKADEPGLVAAAKTLGVGVRFVASDEIRRSGRAFKRSAFVKSKVNLPAVAEPSALLAGRRTKLLLPKQTYTNVTVALAVESCMWSE